MRRFFDTNVLVYADDPKGGRRGIVAMELVAAAMRSREGVISTQVLQEYYWVATRKLRMDPAQARAQLDNFEALDLVQVTRSLVLEAVDLSRLQPISFWDALIVRAAVAARCSELFTEDLQHGSIIDGVRIVNPFRDVYPP